MKSSARTPRLRLLASSLVAALMVSSCVDAPSGPDASTFAPPFVFAPSLALVGPGGAPAATQAQEDALNEAFDRVDHFRMIVTRLATGEVVVDTVIAVTPGQESYDLSVTIDITSAEEQFSVKLTALQGTTELFTAEPVTVTATTSAQAASGSPPAATNVTMQYSGPGVAATSVQISPAALVLGPNGSGSFSAEVQGSDGSVISDVPLSWTVSATGVVEVADGTATATGEGAVQVVVATPTGLEARAWAYVVGGELAYAEGGVVKVRGTAGGDATDRSSAGSAGQPAWSPDGNRLFYAAAGRVHLAGGDGLVNGSWPSLSPDGSKLAVDVGGSIMFANDDGTNPTQGPSGGTPVWTDAANLLVSGGSVEQVRADGSDRTTVAGGSASLPARGPSGEVAYVADGQLFATGRADAILDGAGGRPTWSANGMWLVVQTGRGLTLVPADGSAPGASLPGLAAASDPAFKPGGALEPQPSVAVTGLAPDPPTPGEPVTILGSGFDWIIPDNNRVFWPTLDGAVEGEIRSVTEGRIEAVMPRSVAEGTIRVETRASTGLLTFDPQLAAIDVIATTPFGDPVAGIEVVVRDADGAEVLRGQTDDEGRVLMAGLTPATYQVELVMPTGFRLEGEALHTLTLRTETVLLEVEVMPLVQTVTTVPEVLEVEVGSRLEVKLVPVDFRGQVIGRLSSSRWLGGTPHVAATGEGLEGIIIGATPSTGPLEAVLAVALNGDVFELPVSVTSYVEGTVVQDPDPVTTESSNDAQPSTVEATTEPAVGTEVKVLLGGVVVGTGIADGRGHYRAGGLFAGTYDVTIDPTADRSPVPDMQTVVLDNGRPFATADFLMSRASVDHLALDAGTAEIDAIDGTVTIGVTAFDVDENLLGGRRAAFVSLDPAIASVDANGAVTGVTNGVVAIEVTVEGITATINITVDQKAVVITILDDMEMKPMPDEVRAFVGSGGTMLWEAFDANEHPITHKTPNFTSSDGVVASVDAAGVVVPLAVGQSDLTAEMDGATDVLRIIVLGTHVGDLIIADVSGTGVKTPAEVSAEQIGLVEGDLIIQSTGLANLTGLESLLEIDGGIMVRFNSSLTDMGGIGAEYVHLNVVIEGNPLLTTPASGPVAPLQVVNGSLIVIDNDAITNVDQFANLKFVGGDIDFTGNAALENLNGFGMIRHLPGTLYLQGNPLLDSRNNFPALEGIGGDLIIESGAKVFGLPSLHGITGLLQTGGSVSFGNLVVQELHFPVLMCTGGGIEIYENEVLTVVNFPALDAVDSDCGTLTILPVVTPSTTLGPDFVFEQDSRQNARRNSQPDSDEATRELREKYEATEQRRQEARARLDAAREERRATRTAQVQRDAEESEARRSESMRRALEQRDRLDLERVARSGDGIPVASPAAEARAARNAQTARTASSKRDRVDNPQRVYATGPNLEIWGNPALSAVDLTALQWVEGTLEFWGIGPTSLSLPSLQDVGGDFRLGSNPNLTSFSAPMLVDVGIMMELFNNPILSSFLAPTLVHIGDDLQVTWDGMQGAFSLPQLQFVGWAVEFLSNTGVTSVSLPILVEALGGIDIASNGGLIDLDVATGSALSLSDDGADLDIRANPNLETIHIPGLTYVYDGIYIINNSALVSVVIATTASLTMDWSMWIADNNVPHPWAVTIPGLIYLRYGLRVQSNTGLQSVTMASGDPAQIDDIYFWNNAGLQSIAFPSLTSAFDGDFYVQQEVDLQQISAPMLVDIQGDLYLDNLGTTGTPLVLAFDALQQIAGYMYLQNSPGLEGFTLPSLESSRWGGMVWQNPNLTTFGLPALAYMTLPPPPPMVSGPAAVIPPISSASDLWIESNPVLTGFDVSSLMDVDGLYVKDNALLAAFPATGPLNPGARVFVQDNPAMTSLAGLAGVTDLHTLQLQNNPLITDYTGLSLLQNIVYFQMWSGGGAENVSLPALQRVWYNIEFLDNANLTGVSAPALTHVGDGLGPQSGPGNLYLNFNPLLGSVDYSTLATVDAQIQIFNSSLTDLDGFAGLTSPIYALAVQDNNLLTSVLGLAGIGFANGSNPAVVSNFTISGNAVLDDCHVKTDVVDVIEARNLGGAFGVTPVIANVTCVPD